MVGNLIPGQEYAEQVFDLSQADAHGAGRGRELSLFVLVEKNPPLGLALQSGNRLVESLILGVEFGHDGGGLIVEPLLDLAGMLINRLAAALRLLSLPAHRAMFTGENRSRVDDPSANWQLQHGETLPW